MLQHTTRFLYLLFVYLLATTTLYSIDLTCPSSDKVSDIINQNQGPWVCPGLGKNADETDAFNAVLSDINVETGKYTCEYHYKDSGQVATACTYLSSTYKNAIDSIRKEIDQNVTNAIENAVSISEDYGSYFNKYTVVGGKMDLPPAIDDAQNGIPELKSFHTQMENKWESFFKAINKIAVGNGNRTKDNNNSLYFYIQKVKEANGYLRDLDLGVNLTNNPKAALVQSYAWFVKPYTPGGNGASRAGGLDANKTFSAFITGMVTLDTDMVSGYNPDTGKLIPASDWDTTADTIKTDNNISSLLDTVSKYFGFENNISGTIDTDKQNIKSWVDLFTQKIWGFYYNLQRRLDLGYDIISTQLLFIMMVFFAMSMAARGGARYITNRENGHSSGEVKINEAAIMKTLGILAAVFTFYISVPYSNDQSTHSSESQDLEGYEMRTNSSLAKTMIRYAMKEGSVFGTMMSDLGTDAFLNYVVSKQGLSNLERNNVIESMMSMAYYFPAYQIADTCRMQYGTSDLGAIGASGSIAVSPFFSQHYKEIPLTSPASNAVQVNGVSDRVCRQMFARTEHKLEEVAYDFAALLEMIHRDMYVRMNATYSLVRNHMVLQKALGWMNIVSIPYTYFIMKNENLFYEANIDYDAIDQTTKEFASNLGLKDSDDVLNETVWVKDIEESKSRVSDAKDVAKNLQTQYTRFAVYNFLPGFTSIRNEVLQRIQSLYSDILRLRQKSGSAKLMDFRNLLDSMIDMAERYYTSSKIDIPGLQKLLHKAIPNNSAEDQNPVELHQVFIKISYFVAMAIWKSGFIIVFLSAIAMVIGLKVVLYIIKVMVHFFISPFIVVWAFATSTDAGMSKIKNYLRDTLIYMLYPTIIVIGVFVFIFAYELFYNIYGFITSMLITAQETNISNAISAAHTSAAGGTYKPKDGEMGYLAIYALKDITEILIDLLAVYVAFLTINKFPELVLKMMGVGDSAVMMLPQASEAVQSKGGGSVNPLSR